MSFWNIKQWPSAFGSPPATPFNREANARGTAQPSASRQGPSTDSFSRPAVVSKTRAELMRDAASSWRRTDAIPAVHESYVADAEDINRVILSLPKPRDPAVRRSFVLRLYALYCHNAAQKMAPRPQDAETAPSRIGQIKAALYSIVATVVGSLRRFATRVASRAPAQAQEAPAVAQHHACAATHAACPACLDTMNEDNPGFVLDGCAHAAEYHAECLAMELVKTRLENDLPPRCPTAGCHRPYTLQHGVNLGLDADGLDLLSEHFVRRYQPANWVKCPTQDCLISQVVPPGKCVSMTCGGCNNHVTLTHLPPDVENDRSLIETLIAHMAPVQDRANIVDNQNDKRVRQCYHCGTPAEHASGCDHMVCGSNVYDTRARHHGCGNNWQFVFGSYAGRQNYSDGVTEQCYVPKNGILVRAGFFEPLPPGHLHRPGDPLPGGARTLAEHVQNRAQALGFSPAA